MFFKRVLKYVKRMLIGLGILIGILIVAYLLFVNFNPAFGGNISKKQQQEYAKSDNFEDEIFINKKRINLDFSFGQMLKMSRKFFFSKNVETRPEKKFQVQKIDSLNIATYSGPTRFIWFGHSTFLIQIQQKNILIDPMFGDVPAPHPWLGENRFSQDLPIEIEKIPKIDAVLISHDHYDHLDYGSIQKLKEKVGVFYTPLGVGSHLRAWGVENERIVELDWWQEVTLDDLTFRCTPARHFSGRKFTNRQSTLWSSWILQSQTENIFFSGDSGYGDHFKEIGAKFGPFDFAMLECGQYNKLWPDVHMFPEETAQAGIDLNAAQIMPIHWGAFKLAMHTWKDPAERVIRKAKELQIPVRTPIIGAPFLLVNEDPKEHLWWETIN